MELVLELDSFGSRVISSTCRLSNYFQLIISNQAIKEVKLTERQTSPPDYLTEADLITLMEKHGIGTGKILCFIVRSNHLKHGVL